MSQPPELRLVVPFEGTPRLEFVGIDVDDHDEYVRLQSWLSSPRTARMLRMLAEFVTPDEWAQGGD